ncbi:hypothetical protein GCM10010431_26660 [Streptomyces kunmingensis]
MWTASFTFETSELCGRAHVITGAVVIRSREVYGWVGPPDFRRRRPARDRRDRNGQERRDRCSAVAAIFRAMPPNTTEWKGATLHQ